MVRPLTRYRVLLRKWTLLDIVCLFGVTVRCKASLPSGIHDNAVIQSASHLPPFTLLEETIMGRDGPLSTDEARSHFLDGSVCVCLCVSELMHVHRLARKAFVFRNIRAAWDCCTALTDTLCVWLSQTPTLQVFVCLCLIFHSDVHMYTSEGHINIACILKAAQRPVLRRRIGHSSTPELRVLAVLNTVS